MSKEDVIETEGKVIEVLPKTQFRVMLTNGHEILAYLGGKLRINNIRILEGDKVKIENKGLIQEVNYESQTQRQAYVRQMQSYQKKRQSYGYLLKVSQPQTTSRLIDASGF